MSNSTFSSGSDLDMVKLRATINGSWYEDSRLCESDEFGVTSTEINNIWYKSVGYRNSYSNTGAFIGYLDQSPAALGPKIAAYTAYDIVSSSASDAQTVRVWGWNEALTATKYVDVQLNQTDGTIPVALSSSLKAPFRMNIIVGANAVGGISISSGAVTTLVIPPGDIQTTAPIQVVPVGYTAYITGVKAYTNDTLQFLLGGLVPAISDLSGGGSIAAISVLITNDIKPTETMIKVGGGKLFYLSYGGGTAGTILVSTEISVLFVRNAA